MTYVMKSTVIHAIFWSCIDSNMFKYNFTASIIIMIILHELGIHLINSDPIIIIYMHIYAIPVQL